MAGVGMFEIKNDMIDFFSELIYSFYNFIIWLLNEIAIVVCSLFAAALCYFLEIKFAIHVMLIIIAMDLIAGITASIWRRNESFSMKKFSLAIGRAFVFTAFVLMLFGMDKEMHQNVVATYNVAAWIISGGYLWGFLKNADEIFGGWIFKMLQGLIKKQIGDKTGIDIEEYSHGQN